MDDSNDLFSGMPLSPRQQTIPASYPKSVSHYCDLEAFRSIVTRGLLWASNINFLNDKQEMQHGLKIARDVMQELLRAQPNMTDTQVKRSMWTVSDVPDVYVCCFCENPDLLSQWRGYGAGKQIVSIQFDTGDLVGLGLIDDMVLGQIYYGKEAALTLLRDLLSKPDIVQSIVRNRNVATEREQRETIVQWSPRFKDEGFAEEREWRFVSKGKPTNVQYRVRDNVLLPYIAFGPANGYPLPIRSVTIGPGKESDLTSKSVSHFIQSIPMYQGVRVLDSKIPFRT
ncbi:hypothetical protein BMW22_02045 [Rhizobium leguminosarum]|uniref:DUF2971 domain-containing protein n=1 Tax=Rhizobium leguminosarum TaxID=384 RepID=A0A1L3Z4H5_RHILE|nr:DUF2971 domain-containing protein [Rhizobium leguminosarum]API50575.1 hypothetical protein BMW22_02045 [Rhizobium leguminosarum]